MDSLVGTELEKIIAKYGFDCGIVSDASGEELVKRGDFKTLKWSSLADRLFGSQTAIRQLVASLEGQIIPQIYSQGEVQCAVIQTREGFVIGLFCQDERDIQTLLRQGKEVASLFEKRRG